MPGRNVCTGKSSAVSAAKYRSPAESSPSKLRLPPLLNALSEAPMSVGEKSASSENEVAGMYTPDSPIMLAISVLTLVSWPSRFTLPPNRSGRKALVSKPRPLNVSMPGAAKCRRPMLRRPEVPFTAVVRFRREGRALR